MLSYIQSNNTERNQISGFRDQNCQHEGLNKQRIGLHKQSENGCHLFKLKMNNTLHDDLHNKNKKDDSRMKAFAQVLFVIHQFCNVCDLKYPPVLYVRHRNTYLWFPLSSWWHQSKFIPVETMPCACLALGNELQECSICTTVNWNHLDKHIHSKLIDTIKFDDLIRTDPFGGFDCLLNGFLGGHTTFGNSVAYNLSRFVPNNVPLLHETSEARWDTTGIIQPEITDMITPLASEGNLYWQCQTQHTVCAETTGIRVCQFCRIKRVNALLLPCIHYKSCLECTRRDKCRDCYRRINQRIVTYIV